MLSLLEKPEPEPRLDWGAGQAERGGNKKPGMTGLFLSSDYHKRFNASTSA